MEGTSVSGRLAASGGGRRAGRLATGEGLGDQTGGDGVDELAHPLAGYAVAGADLLEGEARAVLLQADLGSGSGCGALAPPAYDSPFSGGSMA